MTNLRARQVADLDMMRHPDRWPQWPCLPLKHVSKRDETGFPLLGYLVERVPWMDASADPDVLDLRWVDLPLHAERPKPLLDYPRADLEALVADGWVVD